MTRCAVRVSLALVCAVSLAISGCSLRQPAVVTENFALDLAPAPAGAKGDVSVTVLPFTAAPEAGGQMLLYRVSDLRFEHDFYNRLLAPPAQTLTGSLRRWLAQSRAAVVREPGAPLDSDFLVQPRLDALYADYRDTASPRAVVAATIVLVRREASGNRQAFERTYRREVAMKEISPAAAVEGWRRGTAEIFREFTADFRRASQPDPG